MANSDKTEIESSPKYVWSWIQFAPKYIFLKWQNNLVYQQISFQRRVNASLFGIRAGFCKAPKGFLSCYLSDPSFTFSITENWWKTQRFLSLFKWRKTENKAICLLIEQCVFIYDLLSPETRNHDISCKNED